MNEMNESYARNTTEPMKGCDAVPSQPRHIELHQSMVRLESLVVRLEGLLEKISGNETIRDCGGELKAPQPSLSEVLSFGKDSINNISNKSHELINEIENTLF